MRLFYSSGISNFLVNKDEKNVRKDYFRIIFKFKKTLFRKLKMYINDNI